MIDTVAIRINVTKGMITNPDLFSPTLEVLRSKAVWSSVELFRAINNAKKSHRAAGKYMPRITYLSPRTARGRMYFLRVEFSAPKLLFGNNFDELEELDFRQVLKILRERLKEMGVKVTQAQLATSSVSAVHYSKNISITDYTSVSMLLKEMRKVGLSGRLDLSELEYRNGGHLLRCHANASELVFYDKIKDLRQSKISEKRAVENDNYCQTSLLDKLEGTHPLEVLRMEVRMGNKNQIKSVFKKIGVDVERTSFQDVFSKDITQKVLLHYWEKFDSDFGYAKYDSRDPYDVLAALTKIDPTLKPATITKILGTLWLIQKGSLLEARTVLGLLGKRCSYWHRIKKEMEILKKIPYSGKYKMFQQIPDALHAFRPLKLKDFSI